MANKKGVVMYYDILEQLEDFSDEQFGKITRAIIKYDMTGEIPKFNDTAIKIAFKCVKPTLDRNKKEYEDMCEKNRQNVQKRWANKSEIPNDTTEYDGIRSYNSYTVDTDIDNDIDKDNDKEIDKDNNSKKKIKKKSVESNDLKIDTIISEFNFTKQVSDAIFEWLQYKKEKKQTYKDTGLRRLLKTIKEWCLDNGDEYVLKAISYSMSNNYSGIFYNEPSFTKKQPQIKKSQKDIEYYEANKEKLQRIDETPF